MRHPITKGYPIKGILSLSPKINCFALVIILFLSYFNINSFAGEITGIKLNNSNTLNENYNGYIIAFVEDSLLRFRNLLRERINDFILRLTEKTKDSFLKTQIQNYREKLIEL